MFHRPMRRILRHTYVLSAIAACTGFAALAGAAGPSTDGRLAPTFQDRVNLAIGVSECDIIKLDVRRENGVTVAPIVGGDAAGVLYLTPHSVRADDYRILVPTEDGGFMEVAPGPVRTLRGELLGHPGSVVAGSMLDDGLHARIELADGKIFWIEPLAGRVDGAMPESYALYEGEDVLDSNKSCGIDLLPDAYAYSDSEGGPAAGGMTLQVVKVAQLACDADYEFYQDWGSVAGVEARINSIINTVNVQYDRDVGIAHTITTILVRTSPSQPYTSTNAETLLNQFRSEWNANHGNITRDVAHLFTGKEVDGGTIGIAWVGVVCNLSYAYGLAQSDFNGNYASATDLSAHELGHNWSAGHCSCTSYTMNPFITSANVFHSSLSIPEITQFRDSRSCLSDPNPPDTGACCVNFNCSIETQADCGAMSGTWLGAGSNCSGSPCGTPPATGACCVGSLCTVETEADCGTMSGTWQGGGSDCAVNPCAGGQDVFNLATADYDTADGTISSGSYLNTRTQDDGYEALTERHTGGPPQNRRSVLNHTWTISVAPGTAYTFQVDAWHDANNEGDDFLFSYSRDNNTFTPMATVVGTSDTDAYLWYVFGEDIAGTLYVRVTDTDQTPGNRATDTLYVDHMYVLTAGGDGDVTPPSAPTSLVAASGDGTVSLDWADNSEGDLDGYFVYRRTAGMGYGAPLNGSPISGSAYIDNAVTNGTSYFYVVSATDLDGNEGGSSNEVSATPFGGNVTMSVESIVLSSPKASGANRFGRAVITVVDSFGNPVAGVDVTASFSGDYNEQVTATTNASGAATLTTIGTIKRPSFTVCVDDVTGGSLTYDPSSNVETCDSN